MAAARGPDGSATAVLGEIEGAIGRLEREVERLRARQRELAPAGADPPRPGLGRALGGLLGRRTARAPEDQPGAAATPAPVLEGSPLAERRPILAVLWGLDAESRLVVVDRIMAAAPPDVLPVFVLDTTEFEPLRHRRALFEHVPPAAERAARWPGLDWELYTARRFTLLCWKWQPLRVVGFGAMAHARLAAWRTSPLLPPEVRAIVAAEPSADA